MPTRNVNLTEHYDNFIETSIAAGRFSNASEAVRAGLHLLEREEAENRAKLEWLGNAAQQAIDQIERGDSTTLRSRSEVESFVRSAGSGRP
jgi:antitoxin ParD1/3/4